MLPDAEDVDAVNRVRAQRGFLTIGETMTLCDAGNVVLDPYSVLIARGAILGSNNVFYPSTTIECGVGGVIELGGGNTFHPGTFIKSAGTGVIRIGSDNQFGDGGFTAKADRDGAAIVIGDGGRYVSGANIVGNTALGTGSQVLGPITVENCVLEAGERYTHPDPDRRAGVLKGVGRARGLRLGVGDVGVVTGVESPTEILRQVVFHPK